MFKKSLCALALIATLIIAGCGSADSDKSNDKNPFQPNNPNPLQAKKYCPDIEERIQKAGYKSSQMLHSKTERELIEILGEPTNRSAPQYYDNRLGKYQKYDLEWLKAEGEKPAFKVTIMKMENGTTRVSSLSTNIK